MFEHFTFGAQAQTRYDQDDLSASPTDTSFISPPTSYPFPESQAHPFDDIVNKFSRQTLRPEDREDARPSAWADSVESPPFDDFTEEELTYVSTTRGLTRVSHSVSNISLPQSNTDCRRAQRQLQTQLQSCSVHTRDINALVEDMVTSNSQCTLRKSPSRPYVSSPPPSGAGSYIPRLKALAVDDSEYSEVQFERPSPCNEDEGFAEMDDAEVMSLRRASTPSGIRKTSQHVRYTASAECVSIIPATRNSVGRARLSYRCMPRMWKRKTTVGRVQEEA